jgi:hypothetical protein
MSLANVAYLSIYTWANPKLADLEAQALVPMFADFPLELGAQQDTPAILRRFADDPGYQALFAAAFPEDDDPFTITRIVQAISCFERTMISGDAPYDRYVLDRRRIRDVARGPPRHGAVLLRARRVLSLPRGPQLLDLVSQRHQRGRSARLPEQRPLQPRRGAPTRRATGAFTSSPATRATRASSGCRPCATSR